MDTKACSVCQLPKDLSEFSKHAATKDGLQTACKACQAVYYQQNREARLQYKQQYHRQNRETMLQQMQQYRSTLSGKAKGLVNAARQRSRKSGLEFDLDWQYVAELIESTQVCPLLGIPLILQAGNGRQPNTPSLDRIDSSKGYTRDNVWIISWRANRIKSDATPEELISIATKLKSML